MPGVHGAAQGVAPSYVVARPAAPAHAIERPDLTDLLNRVVDEHRVTLVVAPAGYGKTAAVSAWARQAAFPVAWLSLTGFDKHPQRLERGLLTALEPVLGTNAADLSDLLRRPGREAAVVLDDVHVLGAGAVGVLDLLVSQAPAMLRVVLVSRQRPMLRLQRVNAAGGLGVVPAEQLTFSTSEVRLAAQQLGRRLTTAQAESLESLTDGWPVAVRLALMSGSEQTSRLVTGGQLRLSTLTDYLVEEVLGELPPVLRDFLLTISISDWITSALATQLSGDDLAPAMVEDAIARGIPIERRGSLRGEPVYRWHPLVADQCRALLRRQDPARAQQLHLRAAELLAGVDEALAARHALAGQAPQLAAEIITGHWLDALLRGDAAVLEEVCLQLPAPWSDDPEILTIRATCRTAADDSDRAAPLRRRANAVARDSDPAQRARYERTFLLSDLLVADDAAELLRSCQRVRELLDGTTPLPSSVRSCAWFLVGFAEVRLRRTRSAIPALRDAAATARAEGLGDIAGRATANLTFALAFLGDFAGAEELLQRSTGDDNASWRRTEGRPEWFALAWMSFWRAETEEAERWFAACVDAGGAVTSFATMARIWLAVLAASAGGPDSRRTASAQLAEVSDHTVQGLPFRLYKVAAQAQLALADRRPELAVELLDSVLPGDADVPSTLVIAAEIYAACGRPDDARACLRALERVDTLPSYAAVSADVVAALLADQDGQPDETHRRLERALELAAPDRILRPFVRAASRLPSLLAEHAQRGTLHQGLLATALARHGDREPVAASHGEVLSSREREVLGYLQTALTGAEIAAALVISQNTLKTHQRSIYRKLGVSSRREAVRATQPVVGPHGAARSLARLDS